MRLTAIQIKGFKSFPLDTQINFNERVTGVVGPNGSGKSNIVDAIRWVLGEQKTSELRLGAMSDVLFNGTKKRKKSGLAQVTLHFDNTKNLIPTEYHQISVARLLFRNGDSEYRINDVPCRLKDIRSLFADTGIGPDSYAIIALNMVDDILTDSNGSRRRMFEQASGISKYKKRKQETLNKLKVTSADLDRVEDLLFEIENNLKELEKQARRVERFLKIKEQYQKISVQLHLQQYDEISLSRDKFLKEIQTETDNHRGSDAALKKLEAELLEHKNLIISSEQELSEFQKGINSLLDAIRKSESDKQLISQQIEFNKQKNISLDKEQDLLFGQFKKLEEELVVLKQRIDKESILWGKLEEEYNTSLGAYEEVKAKYEFVKADHDEMTLQKRKFEDSKFRHEKDIAVWENQIDRLKISISRNREKVEELDRDKKQGKQSLEERGKTIQLITTKLNDLLESNENRKDRIKVLEENRDAIRQLKDKTERKLDARLNEYDLIKSMIDSLEGFPESVKYLNKTWKSDSVLLTDIIYAPDQYKLSIESFLEPYLNYYVVEDQQDAYEAINLLHGAQKGKANFFLLDKVSDKIPVTDKIEDLTPAIDVMEFDEKYLGLISRLLHGVYITDMELDDIDLMEFGLADSPFYIIDRNGAFIASNYSLTGGSVGLFEGKKLGRKKNLEKLQVSIQKLKKESAKMDQEIVKLRSEISKMESNHDDKTIEETKKAIEEEKLGAIELEMSQANISKQYKTIKSDLSLQLEEIDQLDKSIINSKSEIGKIEKNLELLFTNKGKTTNLSLQELSDKLSKSAELKNKHNIELIKHQNLLDTLKSEFQYKSNDLEKTAKNQKENIELKADIAQKLIELENEFIELDKKLIVQYEDKRKREVSLSDVEKTFYEKRSKINELEEEISKLRRSIHQSQFLINELKEKLHDQEFRLQSVSERLKIEFNLKIEALLEMERSDMPLLDLETQHDRLKRKIENFGEVNTFAVEAFNEMKIRFDTITQQKEDIIQSKETLLKTIDEIENIATKKYLETFSVVKEYFKDVFTSLFQSEDTCDILMEDPERPLESRIEIIAKPKGKRPKTLNQLSGGEKTLTAIALLFSLYLYKPAPFCIFDEVDAPLDDANIEKFNRIVKKFSKDSQFIIITHNKATMAAVDILYGVFMQELGVSEVAAVDFRHYEHKTPLATAN